MKKSVIVKIFYNLKDQLVVKQTLFCWKKVAKQN